MAVNEYYDFKEISERVSRGEHRETIGSMWDEIGSLQFEFLKSYGLKPWHRLVDVGCGCLRGGVHFVQYLEPNNYFGTDINQSLLDAGYDIELERYELQSRLPRSQLRCDTDFDFSTYTVSFDFALAQSLFTHLPANHIRLCLARLQRAMAANGSFFATFFIVPDDLPYGAPFTHVPGDVVTNDHRDPYHYRFSDLWRLCEQLPWHPNLIGDFGHPRSQKMVLFEYEGHRQSPHPIRGLDRAAASALPAGADHYRAFVGPPDRYDFMSASQFALLFSLGVRETSSVLDFGCGSLRLGRLLIPYLAPDHYFGIEPYRWLVEDAIKYELGASILEIKAPKFSYNADFRCDVFGEKFDFIVAQSIITHCDAEMAETLSRQMAASLKKDGKVIFSIIEAEFPTAVPDPQGWSYPHCVSYGCFAIEAIFRQSGLFCKKLPWYHPGATWYVAGHSEKYLPLDEHLRLLSGAVLFAPQFAASIVPG